MYAEGCFFGKSKQRSKAFFGTKRLIQRRGWLY
jgi:hypothetical protein